MTNDPRAHSEQSDVEPRGTFCCPICMRDTPHHHDKRRWIGVDFDGTLAHDAFDRTSPYELGEPIMPMVYRVRDWVAKGFDVRLMTARMCPISYTSGRERNVERMEKILRAWCRKHIGAELPCTNVKDGRMEVLWDDRAVRVVRDSGTADVIAIADAIEAQAAEIARLTSFAEEAMTSRRNVAHLLAENAALAKLVDEAIDWHHAHADDDGWLDYAWVERAEALRAGQQKDK